MSHPSSLWSFFVVPVVGLLLAVELVGLELDLLLDGLEELGLELDLDALGLAEEPFCFYYFILDPLNVEKNKCWSKK